MQLLRGTGLWKSGMRALEERLSLFWDHSAANATLHATIIYFVTSLIAFRTGTCGQEDIRWIRRLHSLNHHFNRHARHFTKLYEMKWLNDQEKNPQTPYQ